MERERAEEIGLNLVAIVDNMNAIKEEELEEILRDISRDEGIGPLLDPTRWRDGGLFEVASGSKRVLGEILRFKRTVQGIGNFK